MIFVVSHVLTCIYYEILVNMPESTRWTPPSSSIILAEHRNHEFLTKDLLMKYSITLYYSTCLLFKHIEVFPATDLLTVYSAFIHIIGKMMTAILLGKVTIMMERFYK